MTGDSDREGHADDTQGRTTDQHGSDSESSDSRNTPLSRRKILAGLAGVSSLGLVSGAGTQAFLADRASFGNTGGRPANRLQTGPLDLGLAWETYYNPVDGNEELIDSAGDCEEAEFVDESRPAISLSDISPGDTGRTELCLKGEGNPGWLWIGSTCPPPGLSSGIEAELSSDIDLNLGGSASNQQITGSLCEVLLTLSQGIMIGESCISSDETVELVLEWEFPEPSTNEVDRYLDYQGDTVEFVLDFQLDQCRHNDGSQNPLRRVCSDVCNGGGGQTNGDGDHGISFIAFCRDDGQPLSPDQIEFDIVDTNDTGEPTSIEWESDAPLSTVVLFYATLFENFPVAQGQTSGTATVGDGQGPISMFDTSEQSPPSPCLEGESGLKYNYESGGFVLDD